MRIALTQSRGRLEHLKEKLEQNGFTVFPNPLIETRPLLKKEVREQAKDLLNCQWLLFSSSTAIETWQSLGLPFLSTEPESKFPRLGAVGQKTAQKIKQFGGRVDVVGEPQSAAGLAKVFLENYSNATSVALPQGDRGLNTLQKALERRGIIAKPLIIYQTLQKVWQAGEVDAVVLASPSAVEALPENIANKAILVTLGKTTYEILAERGLKAVCAREPTSDAVLEALINARKSFSAEKSQK